MVLDYFFAVTDCSSLLSIDTCHLLPGRGSRIRGKNKWPPTLSFNGALSIPSWPLSMTHLLRPRSFISRLGFQEPRREVSRFFFEESSDSLLSSAKIPGIPSRGVLFLILDDRWIWNRRKMQKSSDNQTVGIVCFINNNLTIWKFWITRHDYKFLRETSYLSDTVKAHVNNISDIQISR